MASMVEGIISVDEANRVLFCNQPAYRLLGGAQGSPSTGLVELESFRQLIPYIEQARSRDALVEVELKHTWDRAPRVIEVHASPFSTLAGRGVTVVIHDISRIRQLEKVRRDFVANVSHEIKTPLTSIKGYVETLLAGAICDDEINVRFLEKINTNADRLIYLVGDILSLANIESEDSPMQLGSLDWVPVISRVLSQYADLCDENGIRLEWEASPETFVLGDPEAMRQILENLISNGVRYTDPGGAIRVSLRQGAGFAELVVADTGVGIAPKHQSRIFERFYRVDKDRSRQKGGTGLGLAIVKHLVSSLHGTIDLESMPGRGSTFVVSLPLDPARSKVEGAGALR